MVKVILNNVAAWDSLVSKRVFNLTGRKVFDPLMYWSSRIGDGYLYALVCCILFFIDAHLALKVLLAGSVAFAIKIFVQLTLKYKFKRRRPFEIIQEISWLVKPPDKFSFPSGHTAGAFLMATLLSHFFPAVTVPVFVLAAAVGFSRIYNGVHFPSDVIAGLFLGMGCAHIGILFI